MEKRLLAVVILTMIAACERTEVVESVYANAQAAILAGAIERGWIPSFLPPSAQDIHERHNLDTNEVWLRYSMDTGDLGSFAKSCHRIDAAEAAFPRESAAGWWPAPLLEARAGNQQSKAREYAHYRCENGGAMAIQGEEGQVFYWDK